MTGPLRVTGPGGVRATLDAPPEPGDDRIILVLESGERVAVPADLIERTGDSTFALARPLAEAVAERHTIPLVEEQVHVSKRVIDGATTQLHKHVETRTETVDVPLRHEKVHVERVSVDRIVEGDAPQIRRDERGMVIPVLEEVLVVEKRLVLREEIHVRFAEEEVRHTEDVQLRKERVEIKRAEPEA